MTGRRRHSGLRAFAWFIPAVALITVLGAAEALLRHSAGLVATLVALPVAGYALGRWHGSRHTPRRSAGKQSVELARLRGLLAELEAAAGRPAEAILASYRAIQRRYGGQS